MGILLAMGACNKYLDVIPDNIATIDNAFTLRNTAEQYLFTCYSFMPSDASMSANPALMGADELWHFSPDSWGPIIIARGNQNKLNPLLNYWSGVLGAKPLFRGIRECNIFLDNVDKVPDLELFERDRWVAEVKFLKAYYHFYLFRMYGPIPIIQENLPISADIEAVKVPRRSVDEVIEYVVGLLDESLGNLPDRIESEQMENGRITKAIALSLKAKVLVTAASPLFNGNQDYAQLTDHQGNPLFGSAVDPDKWQRAANACKEAIDFCHGMNIRLYDYNDDPASVLVTPETRTTVSIRNGFSRKWSQELIWGNTNSMAGGNIQLFAQARLHNGASALSSGNSELAPTLKMAELFYTKNGVPIDEDNSVEWDYSNRYALRTAGPEDRLFLKPNYTTAALHFYREPRFYANLGFDGSSWYGQGRTGDADLWYVEAKLGQPAGRQSVGKYSETGYWPKKLVNVETVHPPVGSTAGYTVLPYAWPILRLADLYLLYAEALNEQDGPSADVYFYLNAIRSRAGLKTVEESWTEHSTNPTKYTNKEGLRQIIHRERAIELAFEGQRFWDLRRWKTAIRELNGPVRGWDIEQSDTQLYYRVRTTFNQTFQHRDYFWPIREHDMIVNKNLVQNQGW